MPNAPHILNSGQEILQSSSTGPDRYKKQTCNTKNKDVQGEKLQISPCTKKIDNNNEFGFKTLKSKQDYPNPRRA